MLSAFLLAFLPQAPDLHWDTAAERRYWQALHLMEVEDRPGPAADALLELANDEALNRLRGQSAYLMAQAYRALMLAGRPADAAALMPNIRRDSVGTEFEDPVREILRTARPAPQEELDPDFLEMIRGVLSEKRPSIDVSLYGKKVLPYCLVLLGKEDKGDASLVQINAMEIIRRQGDRAILERLLETVKLADSSWLNSVRIGGFDTRNLQSLRKNWEWFLIEVSRDDRISVARLVIPALLYLAGEESSASSMRLTEIWESEEDTLAVEAALQLARLGQNLQSISDRGFLFRIAAISPQRAVAAHAREAMVIAGMHRQLTQFTDTGDLKDLSRLARSRVTTANLTNVGLPSGGYKYGPSLDLLPEDEGFPRPENGKWVAAGRRPDDVTFEDVAPMLMSEHEFLRGAAVVACIQHKLWDGLHEALSGGKAELPVSFPQLLANNYPDWINEHLVKLAESDNMDATLAARVLSRNPGVLTWPQIQTLARHVDVSELVGRMSKSWGQDPETRPWLSEAWKLPDLRPNILRNLTREVAAANPMDLGVIRDIMEDSRLDHEQRENLFPWILNYGFEELGRRLDLGRAFNQSEALFLKWAFSQVKARVDHPDGWRMNSGGLSKVVGDQLKANQPEMVEAVEGFMSDPGMVEWFGKQMFELGPEWTPKMVARAIEFQAALPSREKNGIELAKSRPEAAVLLLKHSPLKLQHGVLLGFSQDKVLPKSFKSVAIDLLGDPDLASRTADVLSWHEESDAYASEIIAAIQVKGLVNLPLLIRAMGRMQLEEFIPVFIEALSDRDGAVASEAAAALNRIKREREERLAWLAWQRSGGEGGPIDSLLKKLGHADAEVRLAAIASLGTMGAKEALPVLVELMTSEDAAMKAAAALAVKQINAVGNDAEGGGGE